MRGLYPTVWLLLGLLTNLVTANLLVGASSDAEKSERPAWTKGSESLPDFPKPEPEKFLTELKKFQPDGSPCRVPQEDWESAKCRIKDSAEWQKWLVAKRETVDKWMSEHHDHPGWKAGWFHDFVSPKDGSFLVWSEEIPGENGKTLTDKSGEPVALTPKLFEAWVYRFRQKHLSMVIEAARLYRLTGEVHYAEWAGGQLDFYANNLESWPVGKGKGNSFCRLGCQSLDDATMLTQLTEAARLLFDWAGPERRQMWFEKLFKPQSELLDRSFQTIHNIATWQRSAQAGVALLFKDEEMWKRAVDGKYGFRAQVQKGITSDYIWHEQSMGYNSFVVKATLPLFTLAALLGQQDRLSAESAIVENLMLAPVSIRFPDDSLPNPADEIGLPKVSLGLWAETSRLWPTYIGLKQAQKSRSWDTLLDPQSLILGDYSLPAPISRNLESSRFAQLVSGPWQIFFHYGQLTRSHSQAEALNWSAEYNSIDITHDPGTVGYGSPLCNGYYRRGLAQNVPLIDGEGQEPWNRGELFAFDEKAATVSAAQPQYRPNASAQRTLKIEGNALVDEATIRSTANTESALGLALHLQGKPRLGVEFQPVANFADGRSEPFKYWKDVKSATFKDRAELDVEFSKGLILHVTFSVSGEFTLYTGSSPDSPPKRRTGFYLETRGREATFVTRLAPVK